MDLDLLRQFAAVARHQNVSKAAAELSITQPAMSRAMSHLERELGLQLFERLSNRIILNKNGQQFYATVLQSLQSLDDGITNIKAASSIHPVEIRLLILQSRNLVIDLIADFTKIYPNVKFTIFHNRSYPESFEFDFCLASEDYQPQNLKRSLLFSEEIMLAVHQDHPLARNALVTIDDLRNEKYIALPQSSELARTINKACAKQNFTPDNVIICDDPFYVRKYVSLGMGVAFAPSLSWQNLWPDNVVLLPVNHPDFKRSTCLYAGKGKAKSEEYQLFQNYLLTHIIGL